MGQDCEDERGVGGSWLTSAPRPAVSAFERVKAGRSVIALLECQQILGVSPDDTAQTDCEQVCWVVWQGGHGLRWSKVGTRSLKSKCRSRHSRPVGGLPLAVTRQGWCRAWAVISDKPAVTFGGVLQTNCQPVTRTT